MVEQKKVIQALQRSKHDKHTNWIEVNGNTFVV
jgi:hypothetical protein